MKQFLGAFLGMLVGGAVLAGLGTALLGTLAIGVGVTWFVMAGDLEAVGQSPVNTTQTTRRSTSPAPSAAKGALQIHTFAAVQMQVDGRAIPLDTTTGNYTVELPPGKHLVQVYNAWLKEVAREEVTIRSGRRLMLDYVNKQKVFSRVGEVPFAAAAAPQPVAAPQPAPAAVLVVQPAPAPAPVVQVLAQAVPEPSNGNGGGGVLGLFKGLSGDSSTRRKSTTSSTQYGEVNTHGPGHSETHGYEDHQSDEVETTRRRRFGL